MILDHIAFRSKNRLELAEIFKVFGYRIHTTFDLKFDDGSTTDCLVMIPKGKLPGIPPVIKQEFEINLEDGADYLIGIDYQMAPELFISDGKPDSIVDNWVNKHGTGVHHLAFSVAHNSIEQYQQQHPHYKWLSQEPIVCDGLRQIFFQLPNSHIVIELIERSNEGFCRDSVKKLMESTKGDCNGE